MINDKVREKTFFFLIDTLKEVVNFYAKERNFRHSWSSYIERKMDKLLIMRVGVAVTSCPAEPVEAGSAPFATPPAPLAGTGFVAATPSPRAASPPFRLVSR